jgi:hypothetical protein
LWSFLTLDWRAKCTKISCNKFWLVYTHLLHKRDSSVLAARTRLHSACSVWGSTFFPRFLLSHRLAHQASLHAPVAVASLWRLRFFTSWQLKHRQLSRVRNPNPCKYRLVQIYLTAMRHSSLSSWYSTGHAFFFVVDPEGSYIFHKYLSFDHILLQFIQICNLGTNLAGLLKLEIHTNNI